MFSRSRSRWAVTFWGMGSTVPEMVLRVMLCGSLFWRWTISRKGSFKKNFCLSISSLLLVTHCTTNLQPNPASDAKTQVAALSIG